MSKSASYYGPPLECAHTDVVPSQTTNNMALKRLSSSSILFKKTLLSIQKRTVAKSIRNHAIQTESQFLATWGIFKNMIT